MYIPKFNHETDIEALTAFMRAYDFAVLVSQMDGVPVATHLPVTLKREGDRLTLYGHFAKANPQWHSIAGQTALMMFSGPHAYISPRHYEKAESVPTWNYIAVHAYGTVRLMNPQHESAVVLGILADLIARHEPSYQEQWDGLSEKYREGMLQGVIGFEFCVERLEGKFKLSQNRTPHEQQRIAQSLLNSPDSDYRAIGAAMQRRLQPEG